MNGSPDDDLRSAFAALERDRSGPSFAELTDPRALDGTRRRHRRRRGALSLAVLAVAAIVALCARSGTGPDFDRFTALTGIDLGEVTWRAPSDFLLDVPGRDLLRTTPLIEIQPPALPADSVGPADSNANKRRRSDS